MQLSDSKVIYNQTGYQYTFKLGGALWQTHANYQTQEDAEIGGAEFAMRKAGELITIERGEQKT